MLQQAATRAADAAPQRLVLFQWGVSSYYGWGVYGLNMMLAWAGRTDFTPASLQPIDPASLDLDPLGLRQLAPALKRSAQVQQGLQAMAGRRVHTAHVVLSVIKNDLAPDDRAPHDVEAVLSQRVATALRSLRRDQQRSMRFRCRWMQAGHGCACLAPRRHDGDGAHGAQLGAEGASRMSTP